MDAPGPTLKSPFAAATLDVATVVRAALDQMAATPERQLARFHFAVQPNLTVSTDRRAIHEILGALLVNAVHHAPAGCVLLTAIHHGGAVEICVTDDGIGPDRITQEVALRPAQQLLALQGGTLEVARSDDGSTTATVRLPGSRPIASLNEAWAPVSVPIAATVW
jgi:glucose-6-phosphate-specific signal transduction histidine kinase